MTGDNGVEKLDDGREPMEWDKGDQVIDHRVLGVHLQAYNARKGRDPSALFRVHGCDDLGEHDEQRSGVPRGGSGRIWKCIFP